LKRKLLAEFERVRCRLEHPCFSGRPSAWLLAACGNSAMKQVFDRDVARLLIYVYHGGRKNAADR
jgi:hypothetical protein